MVYNDTFLSTSNNIVDIFVGINVASGGLFTIMLLVVIWLFAYAGTVRYGPTTGFMSASFATTIVASLFWAIGLIGWSILAVPATLFLISVVIRFFQD